MKIFVSSVIGGLEEARSSAAEGIRTLGGEPVLAEDYGARSDTPQQACLAGVRDSEVVVLVLGERYGYPQGSGLSATHEEYQEAKERRPVLAFIQAGINPEPEQENFIQEVQDWASGNYTENFSDPEELKQLVIRRLHEHEMSRVSGSVDEQELLSRASTLVPAERGYSTAVLSLVVVGGPRQTVLSPSELEDSGLEQELLQHALFGEAAVLDPRSGTNPGRSNGALVLEQQGASVYLDEEGNIGIFQTAWQHATGGYLESMVIIEEDVQEALERGLKLAAWAMKRIDPVRRLSDIAVVATLLNGEMKDWRTREQHRASSSHGVQVPMRNSGPFEARLSPPVRKRAALEQDATRMSSDLMLLLRRRLKG